MKSMDIMLDLETTGVSAGCCILSIGACSLNLEHKFYAKIDIASCERIGLTKEAETMAWWGTQSAEAKIEAFTGNVDILVALGQFADFLLNIERAMEIKGRVFIWGNGADFDQPLLGAAYLAAGMAKPWGAFNGRCYRTVKNLPQYRDIKIGEFRGMKHNALDDAVHQATHLRKILRFEKARASIPLMIERDRTANPFEIREGGCHDRPAP